MSSASPSATVANKSPVAGLRLSKVFPDADLTHSPLISIRLNWPSAYTWRTAVMVCGIAIIQLLQLVF
jgi:hypothetical protein